VSEATNPELDCRISSSSEGGALEQDLAPGHPDRGIRVGCRGFTGPVPLPLSIRLPKKLNRRPGASRVLFGIE